MRDKATQNPTYTILLYYKYVAIDDPETFAKEHKAFCQSLGLKGRIIVAKEGINGTCEGTTENTDKYIAHMKADPRFADIHWKISAGTVDGTAFPKLSVKPRKEIVSLHLDDKDRETGDFSPTETTGKRLAPSELQKWFDEKREFTIVDMRNDYEYVVGAFKGSVLPTLSNFRDLADKIDELEPLKEKTVLTVCTGGVRCEKASGYLVKKGFKEVYQLDGGIVSYMEKFPGKNFEGSLYVFDKRMTMHFDKPEEHKVIGRCVHCHNPCESYVNCVVLGCHRHIITCAGCIEKAEGKCELCVSK